ncbi:MFS transporter [Nocardioides pocheonensis]|uniref:MFS transporter n=1 Tax=Nocardioides pocheonensis TaxID=661485 RepID=A0A3N0GNN5_9ACTN|nr:MFS transporter [Nocardioides pocheonensis]RNM13826.1 MFS transporter [Nocardioides pocheonensis]
MTQTAAPQTAGVIDGARSAIAQSIRPLGAVFRNPALRRMQLALLGSLIGDWAYATAVAVFAYGVGGAKAVGFYFTVRLALMAVASPFFATLADRMPRRLVMIGCDLLRFVLVSAAAACLYVGTPAWPVFVLAGIASVSAAAFRPAQNAWMPSLADSTEELTAANGASSTLESLSFFIGPAIGAFLLTLTDVPTVFMLNAATFLWSALLVTGIHARPGSVAEEASRTEDDAEEQKPPAGVLRETAAGFRAVTSDRDILMVGSLLCAQTVVAGASAVFGVVLAVEILQTGPKGVGYIDSAFGVGAIIGGFVAIARAARRRLALDLSVGVILWSIPLLALWAWPHPATVFAAIVLMGFGNPLVDVNFATILQRITPDAVLGRVFGTVEGACIATMALGSLVMPLLIKVFGLGRGLGVLGAVIAVLVLPWLPRALRLDRDLAVPAGVPLLNAVPMFEPLTPATIENLARKLVRFEVPAGSVIVREGQESDRFFVVESGGVSVSHGDVLIRHEGPGDFFGEIGLLRDVPRTATVTADTDTVLQVLEREDFLDAVTGQSEARMAADAIVSRRIAL